MKRRILLYTALALLLASCSETDFLKPDFVKIYLQENDYTQNMLAYQAYATPDNGYILFGVEGNLQSIYDRVNTLIVLRFGSEGELHWIKKFPQEEYGFPSNIIPRTDGFDLFWSEETRMHELHFRYHSTDTMVMASRPVACLFDAFSCNKGYKIVSNLQDDGYLYLNYGLREVMQNAQRETDLYTFVASAKLQEEVIVGQYICETKNMFPNLNQYNPATRYTANFWIDQHRGLYYINTPYQAGFALLGMGNEQPIYTDPNYWIGSYAFVGGDQLAAIISPKNLSWEEGKVYFAAQIPLTRLNQNFQTLSTQTELLGLDANFPMQVLPYNDVFYVAGTNFSGATVLYVLDAQGGLLRNESFGELHSFQFSSMQLSNNRQHLAIFGTTKVNGALQRPFFIKVPLSELR